MRCVHFWDPGLAIKTSTVPGRTWGGTELHQQYHHAPRMSDSSVAAAVPYTKIKGLFVCLHIGAECITKCSSPEHLVYNRVMLVNTQNTQDSTPLVKNI